MSATSPSSKPPGEEEPSELVKFREEWLAELRRRKDSSDTNVPAFVGIPDIPSDFGTSHVPNSPGPSHPLPATHPALSRGEILPQSNVSTTLENALSFYRQAVEHEQRSDLDQALQLYRQAFRLVCVLARRQGFPISA
jgi:F-box protein 9